MGSPPCAIFRYPDDLRNIVQQCARLWWEDGRILETCVDDDEDDGDDDYDNDYEGDNENVI